MFEGYWMFWRCVRHNFGGAESARRATLITSDPEHGLIAYSDRLYSEVRQGVQWLSEWELVESTKTFYGTRFNSLV